MREAALELDKAYIPARYPNAHPSGAPRRRYTRAEAARLIDTLAFDMDALDSPFPRTASVTLQAVVFDDDENPLVDWTTTCTCVKSPTRLSALNPVYATTNTYTEIFSPGVDTDGRDLFHTGYMNIEIHIGANDIDLFGRLHRDDADDF